MCCGRGVGSRGPDNPRFLVGGMICASFFGRTIPYFRELRGDLGGILGEFLVDRVMIGYR